MTKKDDYFKKIKNELIRFSDESEYISDLEKRIIVKTDKIVQPTQTYTDKIAVQESWNDDRIGRNVADLESLRQELDSLSIKHYRQQQSIYETTALIPTARDRSVIEFHYILGDTWSDICFFLYGHREDFIDREESFQRQVFRMHNRGINTLAQICLDRPAPDRPEFLRRL